MIQSEHQTSSGIRILICTQAVDKNDPILGFFHRWIEEFAVHTEHIMVICLRKGEHSLPANVEVIALGETHRVFRALELVSIAWGRRKDYDSVFVHMNPEYAVAAGWLWRILGKRIVLWYVHKSVTVLLRIAVALVHTVATASKESFRYPTSKLEVMGHGIDTDFFSPGEGIARGDHVLSVGRLMPSKRHDLIIRAAALAQRPLRIAGEGAERESLAALAQEVGGDVTFLGGLTQEKLRNEYRTAAHFIHTSTTGSMDKVVLEAAACDCNVITTVDWLQEYVPVHSVQSTPESIAEAMNAVARESYDRVNIIRKEHSLKPLIEKLIWNLSPNK